MAGALAQIKTVDDLSHALTVEVTGVITFWPLSPHLSNILCCLKEEHLHNWVVSWTDCLFFLNQLHSLYFSHIKLCDCYSWSLGPLHRNSGVGLYKMVSEFLIWRLGEHRLFPEIRSEITVGFGNGIKSDLGEVVQGGGAAPGRGVAVVNSSHHQ